MNNCFVTCKDAHEEATDNQWIITRRDFLKSTGIATAGICAGLPLNELFANESKAKTRFGIVTDSHYTDRSHGGSRYYRESVDKMAECVEFMNKEKVDFLIEIGDFKDQRKSPDEKTTIKDLEKIENIYAQFNGPRYHVLGNHDMDSISKEQFLTRVENTRIPEKHNYFAFQKQGVDFVVLDANYTSGGKNYDHGNFGWTDANIPPEELDWLKEKLASTTNPVIVFVHQLLDGEGKHYVENAKTVRQILQSNNNVLAVFQGHNHGGDYSHKKNIHYYTLKAMVEGSGVENNSYAIVDVHDTGDVVVTGFRKAVSKQL